MISKYVLCIMGIICPKICITMFVLIVTILRNCKLVIASSVRYSYSSLFLWIYNQPMYILYNFSDNHSAQPNEFFNVLILVGYLPSTSVMCTSIFTYVFFTLFSSEWANTVLLFISYTQTHEQCAFTFLR